MTECALDQKPNANNSCLDDSHVNVISQYTQGKTLAEIKEETKCDSDKCVLDKVDLPADIEGKIKREALKAPAKSYDHNYWLNNTEIDSVMSQFRKCFDGFAHGFIHMIDLKSFQPENISTFDYDVIPASQTDFSKEIKCGLIKRGIIQDSSFNYTPKLNTAKDTPLKSYGIVCNTDSSSGSGQHWFSIFISTDQKDPDNSSKLWIRIECFNSAGGGSTNKDFNAFWTKQAMDISRETCLKCTFDTITNLQHQSPDTGNCGSYSLFYIYSRLKGVHPSHFNNPKKMITDNQMKEFRKVCFTLDEDNSVFMLK